jgi:predicted ATPase/DNA-binding CsgD family transcriptional regulator
MNRPATEGSPTITPRTNLPAVLTSFVGRKREIAELPQLLASAHLVSLVGSGGCGKTRVALRVAAELADQYIDGVYWVELARLADSTLVPQAVAKAMNVVEQSGTPLTDTLVDLLGDRQLLLVLDNCEHLLGACAQLVEALADCPNLRILATSREPIGVSGETLYPVLPLALPAVHLSVDEIRQIDSVQLFVERARSILPTFGLTPDNAEIVSTICRDLDGIPLAIELASARVSVLNVKQIQERLDRRLDLLVSTARADERHRTLRAAIDWSYDLLSASERLLLQRLTLFTAGFTLSTAESACAWGEIKRAEVLDLLSSLISKSLVVAETLQGSEARYRLLETIRQYAQGKLSASGEWVSAHDGYLACFLRLTEEVAPKLREQFQQLWFDWLETENDNIRAALAWALEQGRIEAGMRIGTALYSFWQTRAYIREGYTWYERFLQQVDERVPLEVRVNTLTWSSALASKLGDAVTAKARGQEAVALCEAAGEQGKPLLAVALIGVASGARAAGDYQTTYTIGERLIEVYRELGDLVSLGITIMIQGQMAIALGKHDTAQLLLEESLSLARAAGDKYRIALTLNYMGDLARIERQVVQAHSTYDESLSILRELGAAGDIPATQHNLAYVCLYQGDTERAHALFYESLQAQRAQDNREGVLEGLLGFAALASTAGLAAESARLYAAAVTNGRGDSESLWALEKIEYEHYIGLVRAKLSDAEFEAEQANGRTLPMEQAIEYALNLPFGLPKPPQKAREPLQDLTEREREVVVLIARGLPNGEIAEELVLSKRTVEHHIANILSKLGFTNRAQIVRLALENGLAKASKQASQ